LEQHGWLNQRFLFQPVRQPDVSALCVPVGKKIRKGKKPFKGAKSKNLRACRLKIFNPDVVENAHEFET
jgi:hypothetical protein